MPVMAAAASIRARSTIYNPTDSGAGGGGGGGGGSVPADVTAGVAAAKLIAWGDGDWPYMDQSTVTSYHTKGWGGAVSLNGYPYGLSGGTSNYQATTAAAGGAEFARQKQYEGLATAAAPFAAMGTFHHNVSNYAYIGTHWQSDAAGTKISGVHTTGPFGDWHNTTLRATVAAFFGRMAAAARLTNMDGLAGDYEPYYDKSWRADLANGHTAAENRAAAYQWGYAIGQAVFTAYPGCDLITYSHYPPYGWNLNYIQRISNGDTGANTYELQIDFFHGYLAANKDLDGGGRWIMLDATWYRTGTQVAGASTNNALLANTQGPFANMSRYFSSTVNDYVSDLIDITPMGWRGTDGTAYYASTQPSDSEWAAMQGTYRLYGMGGVRAEYNFEGSPDLASGYSYETATMIAGMQAAASTSSVDTTAPSLAVTSNSTVSGTKVLAGTASHATYGIRCVNFYNSSDVKVGAAQMTWNVNGGNYTTNYNSAYMDWTATVPSTATYATAVSTKDQRHSVAI